LVREFFRIHDLPETPEHFAQFFERYVFWLDHILGRSKTQICPGVWKLIHALQHLPQPPALGLLTGNIRLGAEIKLRHFNLWDQFEFGGFADDHEERDHIAAAALARGRRVLGNNLQPQEVVVLGDTPFDVRCGKFIGSKTLAVATGGAKLEELKPLKPDWAVADLTQISAREMRDYWRAVLRNHLVDFGSRGRSPHQIISRRKFFAMRQVVTVPRAQGFITGVFKKKLQRRRFNVAVAKQHLGFILMTLGSNLCQTPISQILIKAMKCDFFAKNYWRIESAAPSLSLEQLPPAKVPPEFRRWG
jgi:phosphoglycolate phosphatase